MASNRRRRVAQAKPEVKPEPKELPAPPPRQRAQRTVAPEPEPSGYADGEIQAKFLKVWGCIADCTPDKLSEGDIIGVALKDGTIQDKEVGMVLYPTKDGKRTYFVPVPDPLDDEE